MTVVIALDPFSAAALAKVCRQADSVLDNDEAEAALLRVWAIAFQAIAETQLTWDWLPGPAQIEARAEIERYFGECR